MEAFVGMINEFSGDTHNTDYTSFDVGKDVCIDRFWFHLEELAETAPRVLKKKDSSQTVNNMI